MTMKWMPLLMGSLLVAGCAAVEPFDAPYALVEVGPISAARKELPVIINAIDGDYLLNPRSGPIKPGKHQLEIQFSTRDGPYWKRKKMVELDAQPSRAEFLRRRDHDPAVARAKIDDQVSRLRAGKLQHALHHVARGGDERRPAFALLPAAVETDQKQKKNCDSQGHCMTP